MNTSRLIRGLAACIFLTACGGSGQSEGEEAKNTEKTTQSYATQIDAIMAGEHRTPQERARDTHRHPKETLLFFGIEPEMSVVEIWPGGGWYTQVIAPFLKTGGGKYYAASFAREGANERILASLNAYHDLYVARPEIYGDVRMSALTGPIAPDGPVDAILTFRNLHNWIAQDIADDYLADFFEALKPGGVFGIVQHRANGSGAPRDGSWGYVYTDDVIALAEDAGFIFEEAAEINANPTDTKDHPFGVWTLPPVSRTSTVQGLQTPDFDAARYANIGESDRMTLRFRKPATETQTSE